MTKREVIGRYRGSVLGIAWSFFNPLIMLAVYTVVFSTVFQAKWSVGSDSKTEFALVLFIGMIIHGVLAESMNNSPPLMLRNISYVKKVVFPLEILPLIVMGSTLFHTLISLLVWSLFFIVVNVSFQWTAIFLPFVFLPLILFSLGVSWMLASLGVYIRDIGQMTSVLTTILLFLSPIFYPASRLPEPYQTIIYFNPLTFVIEQAREVLMWGNTPDWIGILIATIVGFSVAWVGFAWFQKTRQGFADVL
ncbi:MAG: ABC transporter permease [Thiotrichaceae bacterium]|nr:ABC transporter permease [Thiotrichaceae bacterium]